MNFPKLIIFDMDGLMFDTESFAHKAWKITGDKFGFALSEEHFNDLRGRVEQDIRNRLKIYFGESAPIFVWREYMIATRNRLIEEENTIFKMEGLDSLLTYLKQRRIPIAVASSNSRSRITYYLELAGYNEYFDAIISGEDVKRGKPEPDVFLEACRLLNCNPADALVLEDSKNGVEAAVNGEIPVFWVFDTEYTSQFDINVTMCFNHLGEVEKYLKEECEKEENKTLL